MILRSDPEMRGWVFNLEIKRAGSFLRAMGDAAMRADGYNYAIIRPALLALKAKYPKYNRDTDPPPRNPQTHKSSTGKPLDGEPGQK